MTDEEELSQTALEILHHPGYIVRTYQNQTTGETVKLAILVGAPGPIAVHSPEICYTSSAYDMTRESEAVSLGSGSRGGENAFWKLRLEPTGLSEPPLVVYFAWSTGERWEAASNPRFRYGNEQLLYKLQLAAVPPSPTSQSSEDSGQRFLQDLLAEEAGLPIAEEH